MALPLYALTLFVSAFILFLVQPIVGKIILPKLGGTPQVWNTCMVFFQMVLLAGYAYTHNASTRFTLRQQLMAHGLLLLLPLMVLLPFPFSFGGIESGHSIWTFVPDLGSNPIPSTLAILFTYVALPFLVVATTAPLLQKWFVHTGHPASKDPYFLYGASNLGSMLSLIVYPALIEPYVSLKNQGWVYVIGYLVLTVFVVACAAMVWNAKELVKARQPEPKPEPLPDLAPPPEPAASTTAITSSAPAATGMKPGQPGKYGKGAPPKSIALEPALTSSDDITFGRRFRWVMLAAIPSSLMLGITTHITTDLSPIPLFWLIPLILYLGSFILVFARWPVVWTETPHTVFLYLQPLFVWGMVMADVFNLAAEPRFIGIAIGAHVLGFFATTMVCHGELAKDRPSTKYLTEFYLWMSVGGMVGGMFNALVAPVIFPKLWELPLAIFAAGLVRPKMFDTGLFDNFLAGIFEAPADAPAAKPGPKGRPAVSHGGQTATESLVSTLDYAWPVVILLLAAVMWFVSTFEFARKMQVSSESGRPLFMLLIFGLPLLLACVFLTRPLRIGLGIGVVLLTYHFYQAQGDTSKFSSRSFFGAMSVKEGDLSREGRPDLVFRQLIHGHIDHGMNFLIPGDKKDRANPNKNWSRLATTYYHREGPVGRVMEKFNWFPDPPNSNLYTADARMPASLVGSAVAQLGIGGLPTTIFETMWSEPPIATVGLGTGTMASYGRAYQHVHFYEIDNQVLQMSLHTRKTREIKDAKQYEEIRGRSRRETWFNYLEQSIDRGCSLQVLMGDARLRMGLPYKNHYQDETDHGGGPNNFYHMMVVDAFSSDAIPAHLLTEQAFKVYFEKLTEEGVLCVHTSNRFVDLPKVVAAIAANLTYEYTDENGVKKKRSYAHKRGHDNNTDRKQGHYTSEWVMVAKKAEYILPPGGDAAFLERYRTDWDERAENKNRRFENFWGTVDANDRYLWTDDYYNLLSVIRW